MGFSHYNTVMKCRTTACLEEFFSLAFGHTLVVLQTSASGEREVEKGNWKTLGFYAVTLTPIASDAPQLITAR